MTIEISRTQNYQVELRKADAHEGEGGYTGKIETAAEYKQSLINILTGLPIEKLPEKDQKLVRQYIDALGTGTEQFNGIIDTSEVEKTINLLSKQYGKQALLEELVYRTNYKPVISAPKPDLAAIETGNVAANVQPGQYSKNMEKLVQYLLKHDGDPPNAVKSFAESNGASALAIYHNFNDEPAHIKNGGATTSEAQVLFFNFMTLYGAITGDKKPMEAALNYIKRYMMPHDGIGSLQLPDEKLQLPLWRHNPYLIHWIVDVAGKSKKGDDIFGENTTYSMYQPGFKDHASIAQDTNAFQQDIAPNNPTLPMLHQQLTGPINQPGTSDRNTFKFSDAPDATQWLQTGLYWANTFNLGNYKEEIGKFQTSLQLILTDKDAHYPQVMQFGYYWGGNVPEQFGWSDTGKDIYSGYQDPAAWLIMGKPDIAKKIVNFLEDAQGEYSKQHGQSGPFIPVYNKNGWGWDGADPNTNWMGFQYRTFAHLANYYYLSGDKKAEDILKKFIDWTEANTKPANNGLIDIPIKLNSHTADGKGILHNAGVKGSIEMTGYYPDTHGLYAQGLIMMAAKNHDSNTKNLAEKILNDLTRRQAPDGSFPYTQVYKESPPEKPITFGFHQSEVGIAFCEYQLLLGK